MNLHIWRVLAIAAVLSLSGMVCAAEVKVLTAGAFKQVVLALVLEQISEIVPVKGAALVGPLPKEEHHDLCCRLERFQPKQGRGAGIDQDVLRTRRRHGA
jgi:hypothetical protein